MKYIAKFIGRKAGAIGVCYEITERIQADNTEQARLALYEKYEHISGLEIESCCCPSVACPVHGLPSGSASGGW